MPPRIFVRVAASMADERWALARAAWQMELSGSGGLTGAPCALLARAFETARAGSGATDRTKPRRRALQSSVAITCS